MWMNSLSLVKNFFTIALPPCLLNDNFEFELLIHDLNKKQNVKQFNKNLFRCDSNYLSFFVVIEYNRCENVVEQMKNFHKFYILSDVGLIIASSFCIKYNVQSSIEQWRCI